MNRTLTPWVLSIAFAAMAFALGWSLGRSGTHADDRVMAPSATTAALERDANREANKYLLRGIADELRKGLTGDPLKISQRRLLVSKLRDEARSCMSNAEIEELLPASLLENK